MSVSYGQITITSADMPGSGDTARYSIVPTSSTLDYAPAGPGMTWDFSHLLSTGDSLEEYKSVFAINPIYAAFFGLMSFGKKSTDGFLAGPMAFEDVYDFFSNSSSKYVAEGRGMTISGIPVPAYYSDEDELFQFPLEYGDIDNSTFFIEFDLDTLGEFYQYGTRKNEVDGWGTIITPFDTFDCIRVVSTIERTDSIILGAFPFPLAFTSTDIEYKWLANGELIPVFEVTGTESMGGPGGGGFTIRQIRYKGTGPLVPIGMIEPESEDAEFSIVPNPASDLINVVFGSEHESRRIVVSDLAGRSILELNIPLAIDECPIDISGLRAGVYLVTVYDNVNKTLSSKKLIVR